MIIQSGTRESYERAWVAVENAEGATMTQHWPAQRILGNVNSVSVSDPVQAALPGTARGTTGGAGGVIGLCDEDIPAEDVGLVQVYGYHASVIVADLNSTMKTVNPGTPIGLLDNVASLGFVSAGFLEAIAIALDTITGAMHSGALSARPAYANHVYLRAL